MQQRVQANLGASAWSVPSAVNLIVRLADGGRFELTVPTGSRAIDAIRAFGLPLKAECDGRCVCSTCHVRVAGAWASRLEAPNTAENAKLFEVKGAGPSSRLICQLILSPDLDGLDIEIDPASLVPQTYWVAG